MPVFANKVPADWEPGDFLQIDDAEFHAASEPGGLIAIITVNRSGYLTRAGAQRLYRFLSVAIENSKWRAPDYVGEPAPDGMDDDEIAF